MTGLFLTDASTTYSPLTARISRYKKAASARGGENKQRQDQFEIAGHEKLAKDIDHLKSAAKRTAEWAQHSESEKIGFDPHKTEKSAGRRAYLGEKSRKVMKQSKVIEQRQQTAIEEKSSLLKNIESSEALKLSPLSHHAKRLASFERLGVSYGGKEVFSGVSFDIEQGDRIAVCGKNGCGNTSLLKLICGEPAKYSGRWQKAAGLTLSYVSQDTSFLRGILSGYAKTNGIDESLFLAILRRLDFQRIQFEKDMRHFSEGQKKKVLIAASLCERAHLYIWDEPLNFIDVLSRIQIEELLLRYKPTIIFVEHDRAFTQKIATKTVNLRSYK